MNLQPCVVRAPHWRTVALETMLSPEKSVFEIVPALANHPMVVRNPALFTEFKGSMKDMNAVFPGLNLTASGISGIDVVAGALQS